MAVIQIIYKLALSFWAGGVAIFTLVLTPVLFKTQTRDFAGQIVGVLFPGYFRWGLACGITALACRLIMRATGASPIIIIAVMLALTSFQAFYIEPKAAIIKQQIPSFEKTSKEHPLRKQFSKLHGVSASCNLVVLAGGIVLIILM